MVWKWWTAVCGCVETNILFSLSIQEPHAGLDLFVELEWYEGIDQREENGGSCCDPDWTAVVQHRHPVPVSKHLPRLASLSLSFLFLYVYVYIIFSIFDQFSYLAFGKK